MPRLFVAVWPPEPVLDVVAALARPEVPGLRWTGREQWHVTLRFLGSVPEASVAPVVAAVAGALDGVPPVEALVGAVVGRFGSRVLYVPVAGLDGLAERVVSATVGIGRPPEDREFAGHLTLARVGKASRVDLRPLAGQALPAGVSIAWTVGEVCLVESHTDPAGARYEVLERFPVSSDASG